MTVDRVPERRWRGTLVLGSGLVVYDGPGASASTHRHDAVQLTVGVDQPVQMTRDGRTTTAGAVAVASGADHGLVTVGRTIVVLVEPASSVGQVFATFARAHSDEDLADTLPQTPPGEPVDPEALSNWARRSLESLTGVGGSPDVSGIRPVTEQLISYVNRNLAGTPRLNDAAGAIGVSPRHLRRIIGRDLGMPFPRYVLWRRLGMAVLAVRGGSDLTTAAATAGFADSAHFSRVFRSMFGITPSDVLPIVTIDRSEFPADL